MTAALPASAAPPVPTAAPVPASDPVQAALVEVLHATLGTVPAHPARDARLREDLGITSLSMIDVACAAEDRFGVRIPDDDLERFVTLGDAVDFLRAAGADGMPASAR